MTETPTPPSPDGFCAAIALRSGKRCCWRVWPAPPATFCLLHDPSPHAVATRKRNAQLGGRSLMRRLQLKTPAQIVLFVERWIARWEGRVEKLRREGDFEKAALWELGPKDLAKLLTVSIAAMREDRQQRRAVEDPAEPGKQPKAPGKIGVSIVRAV